MATHVHDRTFRRSFAARLPGITGEARMLQVACFAFFYSVLPAIGVSPGERLEKLRTTAPVMIARPRGEVPLVCGLEGAWNKKGAKRRAGFLQPPARWKTLAACRGLSRQAADPLNRS